MYNSKSSRYGSCILHLIYLNSQNEITIGDVKIYLQVVISLTRIAFMSVQSVFLFLMFLRLYSVFCIFIVVSLCPDFAEMMQQDV